MYTDERHFVTTATEQMDLLERIWSAPAVADRRESETQTKRALDEIKTSATSVQAKGVFRAAVLCEDVLGRMSADSTEKLGSALLGLKHLISQYKDGLLEIDPEFGATPASDQDDILDLDTPILDLENPIIVTQTDLQKAHDGAAQLLSPLLKLVKDPAQEKALSFLMQPLHISPNESEATERSSISFDALMHPLNNLILSEARHSGKAVSISYAADFNRIDKDHSTQLANILEIICLNIVANGIHETKDDGISQISVTGQKNADDLQFTVSWRGVGLSEAAKRNPHFSKAVNTLEHRGGQVKFRSTVLADTGRARQSLSLLWRTNAINAPTPHLNSTNAYGEIPAYGGV